MNDAPLFVMPPFEDRAEQALSRVFRGMHHVYSLKKTPRYWTCIHSGDASTFDFNTLTRLVLAAHEYCVRIEVTNGGPRALKIWVHNRTCREGCINERHPTIEAAIDQWRHSQ
jgi:hypothetical protein